MKNIISIKNKITLKKKKNNNLINKKLSNLKITKTEKKNIKSHNFIGVFFIFVVNHILL